METKLPAPRPNSPVRVRVVAVWYIDIGGPRSPVGTVRPCSTGGFCLCGVERNGVRLRNELGYRTSNTAVAPLSAKKSPREKFHRTLFGVAEPNRDGGGRATSGWARRI